ncbi:hypothetical protein DVN95_004477 [Escherichia coli]|nr:hypothetical protein [Escherichia coli]
MDIENIASALSVFDQKQLRGCKFRAVGLSRGRERSSKEYRRQYPLARGFGG